MSLQTLPRELICLIALELLNLPFTGMSYACFSKSNLAPSVPAFEHLFPLLLVSRYIHSTVLPIFTHSMHLSANPLLLYSARTSNIPLASRVLSLGADIHTVGGRMRCNALHYAVFKHNAEMVSFLLSHGADPNQHVLPSDWSLLDVASGGSDDGDVAAVLLRHGAQYALNVRDALYSAIDSGSEYGVRVHVGRGAPLDRIMEYALDLRHGSYVEEKIMRLLVELGADPTDGLWLAVYQWDADAFRLLLELGGDVHDGCLLAVAAGVKSVEMVELLIARGVDVEKMDDEGKRPIHNVIEPCKRRWMIPEDEEMKREWVKDWKTKQLQVLRMLLDAGADVDGRTKDGATLLSLVLALQEEMPELVQILKDRGASVES